jgi:hypothetical protein
MVSVAPGSGESIGDPILARMGQAMELGALLLGFDQTKTRRFQEPLRTGLVVSDAEIAVYEMSWYGEGTVPVPLGGAFHSRRLKIVSSQVGKVAPSRRATTSHRQRLEQAIELLADPRLDALLMPAVPFYELPAQLPDIFNRQSGVLCQRIAYV